jgi:saccharopine dehydrogenase-like NADP-dependent oxidoreductase
MSMRILVLGGCGIQGRTAISDLARSEDVKEVICADATLDALERIKDLPGMSKVQPEVLNAADPDNLADLFGRADAAIDLLPRDYTPQVCQAAIQTGVGVVNTNYGDSIADLADRAQEAGISIMPECGLDPGIDLIIYGEAGRRFDELHVIHSYCGGFPEKSACDNPINYKISWIWEGVLSSTNRDSRAIKKSRAVDIPGTRQHDPDFIHFIEFPGLGQLEAIPNGDAVRYTDLLGVTPTIRETGRYSLRWPGWSAFWQPLKQMGFLDAKPVAGLPCEISPIQFLDQLMGPRLQYRNNEKDLVVMLNVFEGLLDGKEQRLTSRLLIERDLDTGLMAMSKGVGYTASIAAQMIAGGEITEKGILAPAMHIPYQPFMDRMSERGILVEEEQSIIA